jgi:hypothetical protein
VRGDSFTIGELADRVTGGSERAMRTLLATVGADLDVYAENPTEAVPRQMVIDLFATRAGDRVGRKLGELLGETAGQR